jgi:hypothetical protein
MKEQVSDKLILRRYTQDWIIYKIKQKQLLTKEETRYYKLQDVSFMDRVIQIKSSLRHKLTGDEQRRVNENKIEAKKTKDLIKKSKLQTQLVYFKHITIPKLIQKYGENKVINHTSYMTKILFETNEIHYYPKKQRAFFARQKKWIDLTIQQLEEKLL